MPFWAVQILHVLTRSIPSQLVSACLSLSQLVSACLSLSQLVSACLSLSQLVSACLSLSQLVSACLSLSQLVSAIVQLLFSYCSAIVQLLFSLLSIWSSISRQFWSKVSIITRYVSAKKQHKIGMLRYVASSIAIGKNRNISRPCRRGEKSIVSKYRYRDTRWNAHMQHVSCKNKKNESTCNACNTWSEMSGLESIAPWFETYVWSGSCHEVPVTKCWTMKLFHPKKPIRDAATCRNMTQQVLQVQYVC